MAPPTGWIKVVMFMAHPADGIKIISYIQLSIPKQPKIAYLQSSKMNNKDAQGPSCWVDGFTSKATRIVGQKEDHFFQNHLVYKMS